MMSTTVIAFATLLALTEAGQCHRRCRWHGRRRSAGEENEKFARITDANFTDFAPLCDAVYYDLIENDWNWDEEKEREHLLNSCEVWFGDDDENVNECKFYVLVIDAFFEDPIALLKIQEAEATLNNEYQHCGLITNALNDAARTGDLEGITIMSDEDGKEWFTLEEATSQAIVAQALTFGSMLSLWLGTTLVQVCKNFNENGVWLLQAGI